MKRRKQTVIFLLLIVGFSFFYLHSNDLFFSPQAVYDAFERGNHLPPKEGILLEYETGDGKMLIGRSGDTLLCLPVEQHQGIFWRKIEDGSALVVLCEGTVEGFVLEDKYYLGLCHDPEIVEVDVSFGSWGEDERWHVLKGSGAVQENGLFFFELPTQNRERMRVWVEEGKNAEGDILYTGGYDDLIEAIRKNDIVMEE